MARVVRGRRRSCPELLPTSDFHEALQSLVSQMLSRDPLQRPADAGTDAAGAASRSPWRSPLGMQLELLSARLLAVGSLPVSSTLDSTATFGGRETDPCRGYRCASAGWSLPWP